MAATLDVARMGMSNRHYRVTKDNLAAADAALKAYLITNDAYPCPALRQTAKGLPSYGKAPGSCLSKAESLISSSDAGKIPVIYGRGGRSIRIGILPFRSLGLPDSAAVDGWGRLLQYAVTESLTDRVLYNQDEGALDVVAEDGQSRVVPPASIQYVVYSTGPDGLGGWAASGTPTRLACPLKTLQTENCDDDSVFMDTDSQYAGNVTLYDDLITYLQRDPDRLPKGGLTFYYDSCPPGFIEVDMQKLHAAGIEQLTRTLPGNLKDEDKDRLASPREMKICYSPQYAGTIMLEMKNPKEALTCPNGWDNIGYRVLNSYNEDPLDPIYYQFCAR